MKWAEVSIYDAIVNFEFIIAKSWTIYTRSQITSRFIQLMYLYTRPCVPSKKKNVWDRISDMCITMFSIAQEDFNSRDALDIL